MTNELSKRDLDRLSHVISAYGADASRWPPQDRWLVAGLPDESRQEIRNEKGLDRLLNAASLPSASAGAADRILSKVRQLESKGAEDSPAINVVPFPQSGRAGGRWNPFNGSNLAVGTALAASLILGVYLGASGTADDFLSSSTDTSVAGEQVPFDDPLGVSSIFSGGLES